MKPVRQIHNLDDWLLLRFQDLNQLLYYDMKGLMAGRDGQTGLMKPSPIRYYYISYSIQEDLVSSNYSLFINEGSF